MEVAKGKLFLEKLDEVRCERCGEHSLRGGIGDGDPLCRGEIAIRHDGSRFSRRRQHAWVICSYRACRQR